jgi:putative MFS transporter
MSDVHPQLTPPSMPESERAANILRRLERLPMTVTQGHLLLQGGLGYTFDGIDGAIIAFILPPVAVLFHLQNAEVGLLGSAVLIGYLFGAFFAGVLGDLIGRKQVMMYALAIYTVASLVAAFSPGWEFLFAFRVLAGFGTGAESAIIAPFLSEFIQSKYRGRYIGSLAGFFSFGFVGAALLGNFVVTASPNGWRIVQVLTAVPILLLLWWRRSLPESPRWLLKQGRVGEAEQVVSNFEQKVARHVRGPLPPVESVGIPLVEVGERSSVAGNIKMLWQRKLLRSTTMLWILWFVITFSYYGFFTWIPTLLVKLGFTVTKSFSYSLLIYLAQIPGYYSAAFLSEKLDRKWTIIGYMVLGGISALLLSGARSAEAITLFGFLLSFFMNGTYAAIYSYTPEVYPTAVRSTGMGLASAFGRVGGILAPIIIGFTFAQIGFGGVFTITTLVLIAGALVVLILGIRTTGKTLEQIVAEESGVARKLEGSDESNNTLSIS